MAWAAIFSELDSGRQQVDRQLDGFVEIATRHHSRLYCMDGCSNCCSLTVNCSYAEALAISRGLNSAQRQRVAERLPLLRKLSLQAENLTQFLRLFRQQLGGCPLLDQARGRCTIYPQRPYSCRALLSTRNSDWCAVDFADLHRHEREAFLSSLDPELVAFPTHYLKASLELGRELESLALLAMQQHFGVAVSGNLIYQLWLEQEHTLSELLPSGLAATRAYLEARDLDLPFLLQLQGSAAEE